MSHASSDLGHAAVDELVATDRPVDLIAERIDVAIRVRIKLDTDAALTMRTLARSRRILLASPALANVIKGPDIALLAKVPTLGSSDESESVHDTNRTATGRSRLDRPSRDPAVFAVP